MNEGKISTHTFSLGDETSMAANVCGPAFGYRQHKLVVQVFDVKKPKRVMEEIGGNILLHDAGGGYRRSMFNDGLISEERGCCFLTQAKNFCICGSFVSRSRVFSSLASSLLSNKA